MSINLCDLLSGHANNIALSWSPHCSPRKGPLTYQQLQQLIRVRAEKWSKEGLCSQHRILIVDTDPVEQILSLFAATSLDAVFSILPQGSPRKQQKITLDFSAHFHTCNGTLQPHSLDSINTPIEVGAIFYTSGTTGNPMGVMHSNASLLTCAREMVRYLNLTSLDRSALILPLAFHYGFSIVSSTFSAGASLHLSSFQFPFPLLQELNQNHCTLLAGVPHLWRMIASCLEETLASLSITKIINAGDHCPKEVLNSLHTLLPQSTIHLLYGSTEVLRSCHHLWKPTDQDRVIGQPISNVQVMLINEQQTKTDQVGELVHCGDTISLGYWNRQQSLRCSFPSLSITKAYRTGDIMQLDDGLLYFIERSSEILKLAGQRISPREIEEALEEDPTVHEVAAFLWNGELICAISLHHEQSTPNIQTLLPPHLRPKKIVYFHSPLPKTARGKFSRKWIAQQCMNRNQS